MNLLYYALYGSWYLLSLLPLGVLYVIADLLYWPTYHLMRYRRTIIRKNLTRSFPQKTHKEIINIEKQYYHFLCDCIVEDIKLLSIKPENLTRRMTFEGVEQMIEDMQRTGKNFCFVYLGHYGNWEWIASLPYWCPTDVKCAQIYHPLYNKTFDKLMLRLRGQFGGECIPMKETLRRIIHLKRAKQKTIIGFISDQAPKWNSIHHWTTFLKQDTPVFIGTEKIGKQVDALIYYADISRPRRGHYHCRFRLITDDASQVPDFGLTDTFSRLLEENIRRAPQYWLWSHNRWKHSKQKWDEERGT